MFEQKQINLKMPTGWAQCSVAQLETIAQTMARNEQLAALALAPADMTMLKTQLFFALAGLDVLVPSVDGEKEPCCLCRVHGSKGGTPFNVYAWQVQYWIEKQLAWLDQPCTGLVMFPYPTLKLQLGWLSRGKTFYGPSALMQDFSWQRYRLAQDYLQLYMQQMNALIILMRKNPLREDNIAATLAMKQQVDDTKAAFLSMLFTCEHRAFDKDAGQKVKTTTFDLGLTQRNAEWLRHVSDTQLQVILFWWSGMMQYMQSKYPHVYKRSNIKTNEKTNPLELYARMVATMEKHVGLNEREVNDENVHIVLQHMEDIGVTNEEMDKINNKH